MAERAASSFRAQAQVLLMGAGALSGLLDEVHRLRAERVLLVASSRAHHSAAAECVRSAIGDALIDEGPEISYRAPIEEVTALHETALRTKADAFVVVGGGSASDAAKAARFLLAGGDLDSEGDRRGRGLPREVAPLLAVPTTLSGAEVTSGGMFWRGDAKHGFYSPGLAAEVLVFDPAQITDVPDDVLLTTGMNALAHCVESTYGRNANPVSEAMALTGLDFLASGLLSLSEGDRTEANLSTLLQGAAFGGLALSTGGVAIHHLICHALGALHGVPHGVANAVVLPFATRFNAAAASREQERLSARLRPHLAARGLQTDGDLAAQISTLQGALGVPTSLAALGIGLGDLPAIAARTFGEVPLAGNPQQVEAPDDLMETLRSAHAGRLD